MNHSRVLSCGRFVTRWITLGALTHAYYAYPQGFLFRKDLLRTFLNEHGKWFENEVYGTYLPHFQITLRVTVKVACQNYLQWFYIIIHSSSIVVLSSLKFLLLINFFHNNRGKSKQVWIHQKNISRYNGFEKGLISDVYQLEYNTTMPYRCCVCSSA